MSAVSGASPDAAPSGATWRRKVEVITRTGSALLRSCHHQMHRNAVLAAGYQIRADLSLACDRRRLYRRAVAVWTGCGWQIRRLARHRDRLR
jgi:hypothetical protein